MQIQFFGLTSFKITTKEAVVITDPFSKDSGLSSPRGQADIVILSEKENELYSSESGISGEYFLIPDPGEYDLKGVTVTGIPLKQEDNHVVVWLIESEDIKILNLSHIKNWNMAEDDIESLGDIDILIVPVGGESVLDSSTAAKIVNEIEPKIVIPSHYLTPGVKLKLSDIEKFKKEMGGKVELLDKLTLKKKDLNNEAIRVTILEPLR
jgi:L-ascorbate metabolism protein UlaG (beta-lactamase superfamily)